MPSTSNPVDPPATKPDDRPSLVEPAPVASTHSQSNISLSDLAAVFCFLFFLAAFIVSDTRETDHIVTSQSRPTDCDFWSVPIGKKSCHYERRLLPLDGQNPPSGRSDAFYMKVPE
jgi:hypothetical protein